MPLRVEKLSKRYGNTWALRDVGFDAAEGEIFGIFGGIASGKTSLLRCIAGHEPANGGSVFINGTDVSARSAKDRGTYLAEQKKDTGLSSLLGRSRSETSRGEAQIRDFEATIAHDCRVLLLDEPLLGIDLAHRERLLDTLRRLTGVGRTIIFASTDFEQIASICDRIAVIVNGEIGQIGTSQQVYENPESTAVASIVGRNNLFTARRLTSTNADMPEFFTIDGEHRLVAQHTEKNRLGAINHNVTLAIRPEQISISFGASFPEDNVLKAVVTGIRFHGETTLIELDAAGLKLEARVFRVVGLEPGEECMIGMPPDRIHVLKD
jgi:ABC-type Fe3+/spermidine/putrescine transport system ATPase subunit